MLWCMRRTNIYLEERQIIELDRRARAQGVSRADLVRTIIDRALNDHDSTLEADLAAIAQAFGSVPDFPFPPRDSGTRQADLDSIWTADVSGRR
jgi:hypothetical protein